ncbi:molybdenum cofactor biosynthesis protein A [Xenorhabdus beddingii]|uniref:Molybdenum cofactor biosynthesis protein A n=2 Tax=Xenorhabdus beddingii TaxID=40578 RepID=A0A1Y2SS69_9GAMM|nr:molybdenum cofactor biosynthesis protein A [Xenorhabdus beddingii]
MEETIAIAKYPVGLDPEMLFVTPKLNYAFIRINNICNARCEFCDVWQTNQVDAHKQIDMVKLWQELEDLSPQEVNIHGGEAFLSRDFLAILDNNKNTPISITTNGTALSKKIFNRVQNKSHLVRKFYISIDHVEPEKNGASRGIRWLTHNLYDVMAYIKQEIPGSVIVVNHVVTSLNYDTIDTFLLKMAELNVDGVNLIPIKDYPLLFLNIAQIKLFIQKINALLENKQISRHLFMDANYEIFGRNEEDYQRAEIGHYNASSKKACAIPLTTLFIDAVTGNVYPCDTTMYRTNPEQYIMGNILENSLHDIWHGGKFSLFRKKMYPVITCDCIKGCDPANRLR